LPWAASGWGQAETKRMRPIKKREVRVMKERNKHTVHSGFILQTW
jgi:hypothetical protein